MHDRAPGRESPTEGPRHEARERALGLLYEAEMKRAPPRDVLESLPVVPDPFAVALVEGVDDHRDQIDALVSEAADRWELERMPAIDRSILRLGVLELLHHPETPVAVIIDEAVELAKQYSTDASGAFVNGVLAAIARQVRG